MVENERPQGPETGQPPDLRYVQLLFARFDESGQWPNLEHAQRELDQNSDDYDIIVAGRRVSPEFGYFDESSSYADLRVRALVVLPEAAHLLDLFMAVLRYAWQRYLDADSGQPPTITASGVQGIAGTEGKTTRKLAQLIEREGWIFGSGQGDIASGDWSRQIRRTVREFRSANTIEDYLLVEAQLSKRRDTSSVARPAVVPPDNTSDVADERRHEQIGSPSVVAPDLSIITKNPRQIFVAYPYEIPRRDYRAVFEGIAEAFDVEFVFADARITNLHVLQKIYGMIRSSAWGIYDISGWNANVTLELGMAYGLGESAYLIVNPTLHPTGEAPADLRGLDRIQYESYVDLSDGLAGLLTQLVPPRPPEDPSAYLRDVGEKAVELLAQSPGLKMTEIATALSVATPIAQAAVRPLVGSRLRLEGATRAARYFPIR
jgi:hypothetical protein